MRRKGNAQSSVSRAFVLLAGFVVALGLGAAMGIAVPPAHAAPGSLDKTFSVDGKQTAFNFGATGYAVTIDANGRILVAGYIVVGRTNIAVARFLASGAPDLSFGGGDGRVITNLGGTDYAFDIATHPGGGFVVVGERDTSRGSRMAVVRYGPNGGLNRNFGGGDGSTLVSYGKQYQGAFAVVVGPNGKITLGGFTSNGFTSRWALARLDGLGHKDPTFGGDGLVTTDLSPAAEQINDLVFAGDGRVIAIGPAEVGLTPRFAIAKYRLNGTLDRSFANRGSRIVSVSGGADSPQGIARGPNGNLVVVGCAGAGGQNDWGIAVFGPRGKLNAGFAGDGTRVLTFGPQDACASEAVVQPNGRIVVAGKLYRTKTGADFGVVRLKPNSAFDLTFGNRGRTFADFFRRADTARDVVLQANGRIVVAGEALDAGVRRMAVARFIGR
jgi:uncharacterized delta-60 repeat protein